jgi:hypothetical protein
MTCAFVGLTLFDGLAACRRAHQVNHQRHRPQPIEHKSNHRSQQGTGAVGGFGHTHHEHDVDPGDNDQIHKTLGFVRNSEANNTILSGDIKGQQDLNNQGDMVNSDANWSQLAQQMQETFGAGLQQAMSALAPVGMPAGFPPMDLSQFKLPQPSQAQPAIHLDPQKLQALQQRYLEDAAALWNKGLQASADGAAKAQSAPPDRRFSAEAWKVNPVSSFAASTYLINANALMGLAEAVEGDAKTRARIRFAVEQWMAACAPSNFLALNAEAQQKAIESKGESIAKGLQNLMHDMKQGHVSMTDESVFEVGKNVATTEGGV